MPLFETLITVRPTGNVSGASKLKSFSVTVVPAWGVAAAEADAAGAALMVSAVPAE